MKGLLTLIASHRFMRSWMTSNARLLRRRRVILTGFYEWFCQYKIDGIVSGMLGPVREEAGLGMTPKSFITNACESMNAMLKRIVDYKNELLAFMNHIIKELRS